ncbi:MAG: bile acid:sodium symporter family protein [Bacteroidales bacterium]|nr:bile acid:sodium symporter family protein [Bacteroidales bacterium]
MIDTGNILPFVIAFIMLGVGLSLTINDFLLVFKKPLLILIGLFCQLIILPLIAITIVSSIDIAPEFKVGIVIISACPGGATSNLIRHLLKGNVALSIALTAFNSIITLVSIPFIVGLALRLFYHDTASIQLPLGETMLKIFFMTVIPVFIGIFIRQKYPVLTEKLEYPLRFVMVTLLAGVYLIAALKSDLDPTNKGGGIFNYLYLFPYVFALNIFGMITGVVVARIMRYKKRIQITYAIEIGIQNSALGITIASGTTFLNNNAMAIPALIYALFTFFSAILFGWLLKRFL